MMLLAQVAINNPHALIADDISFSKVNGISYFRNMLKKVLSFEGSSVLSVAAAVGGGVEMDGAETVELAVEGAGDARSAVEPEEAYAMTGKVRDSRLR